MKPALHPLKRALRDLFQVEPLEARVLLSADPVLGAVQVALAPEQDPASLLTQAYQAPADIKVTTAPDSTVLVADNAQQPAGSQWLLVDTAQLADGNGRVVVGGPDSNAVIHVGTAGSTLQLGDLVLMNPQNGGEIHMDGALNLSGNLFVQGSGHTSYITSDVTASGQVSYSDSIVVTGDRTIEAGTGGSGSIQLGTTPTHMLNGNGDGTPDSLTLKAADNVLFTGTVGGTDPLEGISIGAVDVSGTPNRPDNVSFDNEVTVNGDLVIDATGTVTFTRKVILTSGGDLRITGASSVVFQAGLELQGTDSFGNAGDIFIEANEIDFQGGTESVKGAGMLTLRPTTVGYGIDVGSLPASVAQPSGSTLNLETTELKALADGFSRIVIGQQDGLHANAAAGNVRIGAIDALSQPTLRDPLEVYGGSISVEDLANADYTFLVQGTLLLDAHANITIANQVEANPGTGVTDITLYSDTGSVQQVDATGDLRSAEPLRAATLTVHAATGIALPYTEIATVSATNTGSGSLSITETASGGDVAIALLSQQAASAGISLTTTAGNISVGGTGVDNAGSGSTRLTTNGSAKAITVNQAIHSASGTITLQASGAITTLDDATNNGTIVTDGAASILLQASGGAIQQGGDISSAGGSVTEMASTSLTMADGVRTGSLDPAGDTGAVTLRALGGDLTVSHVQADGAMTLWASGAIIDGLTGNNPNLDGETAAVLLAAASGIGTGAKPLQTSVGSLAASNTTSGGLFVREATALRIAGGAGSYAIDLAGSDGSMAVYTVDGEITIDKAVRSTGTIGHLLLQSGELAEGTVAGISVRADVASTNGSLSVLSADGIAVDDQVVGTAPTLSVAAAGQTLDVEAAASITAEGNARFATAGGTLHLWADSGDVVLGVADAGTGTVSISAGGRILDGQADDATPAANVIAGSARLSAGTGIGAAGSLLDTQVDTLAAAAAGGPVFVAEANALTVGSVAASTVKRVDTLGAATGSSTDAGALAGVTASGALVLQSGGDLALAQAVTAGGNLRIASGGTLGVAVAVAATAGGLSATSAGTLTVDATGSFAASGGMLDLQSTGGAVTMADGAVARTDAATLRVQAAGDVTVGLLDARSAADRAGNTSNDALAWGTVSVVAGGAIADNAGETATDLYGYAVRLQAAGGIGAGTEQLETEAGQLAATAGAAGLFLTEASGLEVQQLAAITVDRVGLDGATAAGPTDALLGGLTSGGALTVQTQLGSILVGSSAAVSAAGNLLLDAQGGLSDVGLNSDVTSSAGSISILSAHDLSLGANVATTLAGATIDLQAANNLLQAQGTGISSNDGNVALEAGGTATLESLAAGAGSVWVRATGIVDGDAAGDTEVDIAAASAQLQATAGAIGAGNNALETQVTTLSASATGGVFVTESDGLTVDSLQINVNRVDSAGTTAATAHAAQEDLTGATIVLATVAGDLTLNAGTTATAAVNGAGGNVRLEAAAGALVVAGNVVAGASASLLGATGIAFQGTGGASASSTLDVESSGGSVAMAQATLLSAPTARVHAAGDVTVGVIDAGAAGSVSISAGGNIADNAGDTATDVIAASLRLQATGGIGAAGEALETDVAQLSAMAGAAGLFVTEANDLSIAETAAISVQRVGSDGVTLTPVGEGVQDGLASGGVLVLQTGNGSISSTAQGTVSAAGNILLQAVGSAADLSLGALVASSGGSIGLQAGRDALLNADVQTVANGKTVYVSGGRDVTQAQGTAITTSNGGIAIAANTGTATIELLAAGSAGVSVGGAAIVDGDAAGDTEVDIVADRLLLSSLGGIGAAGAELETSVATLYAQASGNVFITEADAVALDAATISVQLLDATGNAQDLTSPAYSGLSGASVVLRTLAGGITSAAGANVAATGNLLLQAGGATSDLVLRGTTSAAGAASLLAGRDVTLTSSVTTTTAGSTIDVQAQGRIDAQQGSAISASDANVQLVALGGSVTLESVAAGTGTVRISGSNIVDGDTGVGETEVDITAGQLLLTATSSAGTGANPLETTVGKLSASAGAIVGILETDGLVLDTVSASVNRVATDGTATATATTTQSNVNGTTITVRTVDGALSSTASGAVTASANVLLKAGGAAGDVSLGAAVTSSGGNISVDAGRDLSQAAVIATTTAGKTIDLVAAGNLTQQQGSTLTTTNGHASLAAGGVLTVETVSAGIGRVSLAGTSIVDGDAAGDTEVDVLAAGVRVNATAGGIGSAANPLETTISTLSAVATGDVFVTETDGLDLSAVAVTVNRVGNNGADAVVNLGSQSNVSGATVVVRTLGGTLSSQATGAVTATGNLLLQAGGASSDLSLAGTAASSGGHVSLAAGQDVLLNANVAASAAGKSVDVVAGRNFVQAQGTTLTTVGGNIGLQAGGSATLESFAAGAGQVRIAAGSVVDGDTAANETEVDVTASALQLVTTGAVGSGSNALETSVQTLAAATGNLFLTETDALTLGSLAVDTQRVGADGTATSTANATTVGVSGATVVLQTAGGSIDSLATAAVNASGNLLLKAGGGGSDLLLLGNVTGAGDLTLQGAHDLALSGAVAATGAGRTLVLQAGSDVRQAQGASASTNDGTLVLTAGGNATLESLAAGAGTVRISAASVIDGDAAGDSEVDVTGGALGIVTTGAIAASANALETGVGTLALQAGGAAFVTEADALLADTVGGTAQRVGADGSSQALALTALSNLTTGGALVLQTTAGALSTAAGGAVSAAGNLLLAAGGASSDLTVGASVTSSGGDVSVLAGRDLLANAGITTGAAGATIDLAAQRDFTQAQGTQAASNGGNIAVTAQTGTATIESLVAGSGGVWVSAASIVDGDAAGDAEVDVSGAAAQLNAGAALGAAGNALETSVATLAARAGAGLFLTESDALTVGSVAIDVRRVDATGASTSTAHAADDSLIGGTVVLQTVAGTLTTQGAVTATGNLLLQAGGAAGDLAIQGATSSGGALSLAAGRDLTLTSGVATAGGSIDVTAQGAITAGEGSSIASGNGNVLLQAGADVTFDTVNAGTGSVRIAGANVVDGDTAAGETEVDVVAAQLQVSASGAVGAAANALETTVATLAITAGGSITVAESDDLSVATVNFAGVNRVGTDGTTGVAGSATQSGIAGGGAVTLTTGGALAIAAATTVGSTGGAIVLGAQGDVTLAANSAVTTTGTGTIDITSATGDVMMDPDTSSLSTGSGDIHVTAEGDIQPGALITQGKAYLDAINGSVLIRGDLQRNGDDIDLFGNDLVIEVPVASPGGTLRIGPLNAGTTVVIGDTVPGGGPALQVDTGELALLQDGFAQIAIGGSLANTQLVLDGVTSPLVFHDPLLLTATGAGGSVAIGGSVSGDSLTVADSGTATTLTAATLALQGDVLVQDQLTIAGANTIAAGQGGSGGLHLTQTVTGAGGAADTLALSANGGNVALDGAVSNLDGLTVNQAANVTFGAAVNLTGDLVIEATGTVTFNGPLTLANGAHLIVRGGGRVVFNAGADLGTGDALLQVSAIQATGGAGSLRGQGLLQVQGTTATQAIHVGGGTAAAGELVVGNDLLRAVGTGFRALQIGSGATAGAGALTLGDADLSVTASPVQLLGSTIAVAATGGGARVGTDLTLHAAGGVTVAGQVLATASSDLAFTSDTGAITMAAGAQVTSAGGHIALDAATGLTVAGLDARDGSGGAGTVSLRTTTGQVADANADAAVEVYAQAVDVTGRGFAPGNEAVLEVSAPIVRVDPAGGLALRESGTDGRVYFNVLHGADVEQVLVAVGASQRVTTDPDAFIAAGGLQQLANASSVGRSGAAAAAAALSPSWVPLDGLNTGVQGYLASVGGQSLDSGLTLSQRLESEGAVSFASGQAAAGNPGFDYWTESLAV